MDNTENPSSRAFFRLDRQLLFGIIIGVLLVAIIIGIVAATGEVFDKDEEEDEGRCTEVDDGDEDDEDCNTDDNEHDAEDDDSAGAEELEGSDSGT